MVLVAVVALGIVGGRNQLATVLYMRAVEAFSTWLALGLSLGMLLIRLFRPRPAFRRLARQPGFVAGAAVFVTLLMHLVMETERQIDDSALAVRNFQPSLAQRVGEFGMLLPSVAAYAVAAAWATLALGGRWRPESDWIDRCGRLMGALWILSPTLQWAEPMIRKMLP